MERDNLLLNLDDPKNRLQYQFYRLQLAFEQLASNMQPVISESLKRLSKILNLAIQCCAKENPRVVYLALHAKKKRVRKKNIKRLYELGLRGDMHDH